MSSIGLDPVEAADFADHVARTPGTPLDDPWFTGSTIASPLMGLATGAANLSFLAEEAATPVLRPFAETLDKQFGTSGAAWLDEQQRLSREQIVRQQEISPRVFGKAGDMVRGLVQYGTEATAGTVVGGLTGFAAGATTGNPWIAAASAIAGAPAGAVAVTGLAEALPRYYKLLSEGVDPDTAKSLAGIEGLVAGGTALLPLHAKTGGYLRSFGHGAALMAEMNAFQRGATHEILDNAGYHDMAEQYKFLDAQAILTDAVMGGLFGVIGHAMHGAPPGEQNPTLADAPLVDSVARDREARGPGIPADPYTRDANQAAVEKSIDDLLQGNPVDVSKEIDPERAKFVADPHDEEFRVQAKQVADEIVGPLPADQPGGGEPPIAAVNAEHPAIVALAEHRDNMAAFTDTTNMVPIDQLVSTKDESADPRVLAGTKRDPRLTAALAMAKAVKGEGAARKPLTVERRPDGKLQVIDGNATVQAAKLAGWTKIPVEIVGEKPAAPAAERVPGERGITEPTSATIHTKDDQPFSLTREFSGKYQITTPEGERVGAISYGPNPDGTWRVSGVDIAPKFQRKGIASAAYDFVESLTGERLKPSGSQSAEAQAFWEARRKAIAPEPPPITDENLERLPPDKRSILHRMYEAAAAAKPGFDNSILAMTRAAGGIAKLSSLKGTKRAVNKTLGENEGDPTKLKDILRATIQINSFAEIGPTIERIFATYPEAPGTKTRSLLTPGSDASDFHGYRDFKANVLVDGHVAEIQVNMPRMMEAKNRLHHDYVVASEIARIPKAQRTPEEWANYHTAAAKMHAGYGEAWRLILSDETSARNSASETEAPLRQTESMGKGLGPEAPQAVASGTPWVATADTALPSTLKNEVPAGKDLGSVTTPTSIAETVPGGKELGRSAADSLEREVTATVADNPAMEIPTKTGELVPAHDAITAADQQITEAAKAPDMLDAAINCDRKAA